MKGWRLVAARVLAFVAVLALGALPLMSGTLLGQRRFQTTLGTLLWVLLIPVFLAGSYYIARWVGIADLGIRPRQGWGRNLLLGAAEVTLILLLAMGTGAVKMTAFLVSGLAVWRLLKIAVDSLYTAFWEETVFRSFLCNLLPASLSRGWVALIVSVIFASGHLGNAGVGLLDLGSHFLSGLFYTIPYLMTGSLWISIGLHWAYNALNLLVLEQQLVLQKTWNPAHPFTPWRYEVVELALLLALPFVIRRFATRAATAPQTTTRAAS